MTNGQVAKAIHNKPIELIVLICAIHTFLYGVGYAFSTPGFTRTLLYGSVQNLIFPTIYGFVMIFSAVVVLILLKLKKHSLVVYGNYLQTLIWLFGMYAYLLNDLYLMAFAICFVWALLCAYSGIMYKLSRSP